MHKYISYLTYMLKVKKVKLEDNLEYKEHLI